MIKNILLTAILVITSVSLAFGQMDKDAQQKMIDAQRAEMKKVDAMVGKWQGAGWIQQGKERETFTGTEHVQRKVDGLALLVEGRFVNEKNVVIHETIALLTYNAAAKDYDFATMLASGRRGDFKLNIKDDSFVWGFSAPGGTIRYTIKITSDTWLETGEMTRDEGKTWFKFFEMNLKKVQ